MDKVFQTEQRPLEDSQKRSDYIRYLNDVQLGRLRNLLVGMYEKIEIGHAYFSVEGERPGSEEGRWLEDKRPKRREVFPK